MSMHLFNLILLQLLMTDVCVSVLTLVTLQVCSENFMFSAGS